MKKIIISLSICVTFLLTACEEKKTLSDYCGKTPVSSAYKEPLWGDGFVKGYLYFQPDKGANLEEVEVSIGEYSIYKKCDRPIMCK